MCKCGELFVAALGWASSGGAPSTPSFSGASCGECLGERSPACQRGKHFLCLSLKEIAAQARTTLILYYGS